MVPSAVAGTEATLGLGQNASSYSAATHPFRAFRRGWPPVFESDEILSYQMNDFVLGTWLDGGLKGDMQ